MSNASHAPRTWKYERAAAEPTMRAHVINRTSFDGPGGCWEWQGTRRENGYGVVSYVRDGVTRRLLAHRLALHLAGRPVPESMTVDHLCRNRACLNPDHLEVVSLVINVMRGDGFYAMNARKTHCAHGHEFTPENTGTRTTKAGTARYCKACVRMRQKQRRAA